MLFSDFFCEKFIAIRSRFSSIIKNVYNIFLPPFCSFCRFPAAHDLSICTQCQQNLPILPQHCVQCARFLSGEGSTEIPLICGQCLHTPPSFAQTHALFPYEPPVVRLIIELKFHQQLQHAKMLGELITQAIRADWYREKSLPDVIIPVPLHRLRLRERGFNQALEIAKPIAKSLHIPIDSYHVKRIKYTLAQSTLSAEKRHSNMQEAFEVSKNFTGRHVAVIDDVITTGATIRELCELLKKQGAKRIDVWCCARCDVAEKAKTR